MTSSRRLRARIHSWSVSRKIMTWLDCPRAPQGSHALETVGSISILAWPPGFGAVDGMWRQKNQFTISII